MNVGVPKEIKPLEGRIALTPAAVRELVCAGHALYVQVGAGEASGYLDGDYRTAGATLLPDAAALYERARLIVKVKEPIAAEYPLLRSEHVLFCYLHLAANPGLTRVLQAKRLAAVAFETVPHGTRLPLLAPMSAIAGKLAVQIGATLLHAPRGGRGILLGGQGDAERGRVVVLGAGEAGGAAASQAVALGAEVTVFARSPESLARMRALGPDVQARVSAPAAIGAALRTTDLLIGAVLIVGARAPRLVTDAMVQSMPRGAAIVDVSVDQGGCIETIRPTDYSNPTYVVHGVTHFAVTNMPGAVPRTASQALSAVLLPYVLRLARAAWREDAELRVGTNVFDGELVHPAVAAALKDV
jgi:alanine dehydrogenase